MHQRSEADIDSLVDYAYKTIRLDFYRIVEDIVRELRYYRHAATSERYDNETVIAEDEKPAASFFFKQRKPKKIEHSYTHDARNCQACQMNAMQSMYHA